MLDAPSQTSICYCHNVSDLVRQTSGRLRKLYKLFTKICHQIGLVFINKSNQSPETKKKPQDEANLHNIE